MVFNINLWDSTVAVSCWKARGEGQGYMAMLGLMIFAPLFTITSTIITVNLL